MTRAAAKTEGDMPLRREIGGWTLAGVAAAAAHVAVVYAAIALAPDPAPAAAAPPLVVELMPLIVSAAEPVAVEEVTEVRPEEMAQPVAEEVEVAEALPEETPPEPVKTEAVEETPDVVQAVEEPEVAPPPAKVELPRRIVKPPEPKKTVVAEKPPRKPVVDRAAERRKADREKQRAAERQETRRKEAQAKADAARQAKNNAAKQAKADAAAAKAASARAGSRKAAIADRTLASPRIQPAAPNLSRWAGRVRSAVAQRKPRGLSANGRVSVRFTVNASGAVTSASIARSSGNDALDRAAITMVRSARIPAPPAGAGNSHQFSVPVTFD